MSTLPSLSNASSFSDGNPPKCVSRKRKRPPIGSGCHDAVPGDVDMELANNFTTDLFHRLWEEAERQSQKEELEAWSTCREALRVSDS